MGLLDFLAARRTSPTKIPNSSAALAWQGVNSDRGRVGKQNVLLFRNWAEHSPWIRAAINVRKTQVSSAEWEIGPFDTGRTYSKRLAQEVRDLFESPNAITDSYRSFVEPVV